MPRAMENTAMKECNVLHNRCDCMNRVHAFANEVVPYLLESLAMGFKLTNGYQLYQKDKDRLQAVIDAHEDSELYKQTSGNRKRTAYIRSDEFDIRLEISDTYPVRYHEDGSGGYTCEYYKKTVYLWNHREEAAKDYVLLQLQTHTAMDVASTRLKKVTKEISELKSEMHGLKQFIGA